jgi:hypothetical protein
MSARTAMSAEASTGHWSPDSFLHSGCCSQWTLPNFRDAPPWVSMVEVDAQPRASHF